jgi:hypothetical protein
MTNTNFSPALKSSSGPATKNKALDNTNTAMVLPKEGQGLSTLDGIILTEHAKVSALEKGVGVVVGNYFVGYFNGPDFLQNSLKDIKY